MRAMMWAVSSKPKEQTEAELLALRKYKFLCPDEMRAKLKTLLGDVQQPAAKAKGKAKGKASSSKSKDLEQAETDAMGMFA